MHPRRSLAACELSGTLVRTYWVGAAQSLLRAEAEDLVSQLIQGNVGTVAINTRFPLAPLVAEVEEPTMNPPAVTHSHIGTFSLANRPLHHPGLNRARPGVFVCMYSFPPLASFTRDWRDSKP